MSQSQGNFSNTTFYLLDDDAENVLQSAGIGPGMLGSRFAMLAFLDASTQVEPSKLNEAVPVLGSTLSMLGGLGKFSAAQVEDMTKVAKMAKADLECAMKAVRAHGVAQMTTDANARGTFPSAPAGTYYLFGWFHRVQKPLRTGSIVWNLKVGLKPGQDTITLSVSNAAFAPP